VDEVALAVLAAELDADVAVMADAVDVARERLRLGTAAGTEAAAFHLARAYNAAEAATLRVARAFENSVKQDGGWHANLLRRMTLEIPGVRPPLFDSAALETLMEMRAFRHAFRHAYDLQIRPDRIEALLSVASRAAVMMREAVGAFITAVARMHGYAAPGSPG
jgi:hypothetical protein